jgi:hypothetical protein
MDIRTEQEPDMTVFQRPTMEAALARYGFTRVHPFLEMLPVISDDAFQEYCASGLPDGFPDPNIRWQRVGDENVLLDGRSRIFVATALERYDLHLRLVGEYGLSTLADGVPTIISTNLMRKHLEPWEIKLALWGCQS